ncbi:uncharacterized protein PAC_12212 [Phialocephala subalpina]|uniref:Uncharacterized protein n=1 Tax=Phialocephala subalpina TaxID=576137 RepID=A0A1L7XBD0_9HELO|nr:uncharacterized protein PAC_12212 [Phialocephala subalpina]
MAGLFHELMKLPRSVYDPSNNCFTTVDAATKSDPWNWYKRPALEYLEDEPLESLSEGVRHESSLSATARAFAPHHAHVVQIKHRDQQSQALVPHDQQAYAAEQQAYAATQYHPLIAPPPQQSTQLVKYRPFERSYKRQDMDRVRFSKAIMSQDENEDADLRTKYKGEETKFQQRNKDCTEEENVAIRMNNLPPNVMMAEVLGTVFEGRNRVKYFDRADELEQSRIFGPARIFSVMEVMYLLHWFIDFKEVIPLKMSLVAYGLDHCDPVSRFSGAGWHGGLPIGN